MLSHRRGLPVHSAECLGSRLWRKPRISEAWNTRGRKSDNKRGKNVAKQVPDAQVRCDPAGQCLVSILPFPACVTAEVHLEGETHNGFGIKYSEITIVN